MRDILPAIAAVSLLPLAIAAQPIISAAAGTAGHAVLALLRLVGVA